MSSTLKKCEKTMFSVMTVYEKEDPIQVDDSVSLIELSNELFEMNSCNCKLFCKQDFPGGLFKFHLVLHRCDKPENNPTVNDMTEFGISKGYKPANIRDLLFFYKACKDRASKEVIDLLMSKEVVATDSNVYIGYGTIPVSPMIKGMVNFNIHSSNGNCPRFILVLMKEEIK